MTDLNRRSFLKGLLGTTAIAVVPMPPPSLPLMHGEIGAVEGIRWQHWRTYAIDAAPGAIKAGQPVTVMFNHSKGMYDLLKFDPSIDLEADDDDADEA